MNQKIIQPMSPATNANLFIVIIVVNSSTVMLVLFMQLII